VAGSHEEKAMMRWLLLGCAGVVAVGILVRLLGSTDPGAADNRRPDPAPVHSQPRPDPSPEVKELTTRLLRDDTLAPPPPEAPEKVRETYDRTISAIAAGNDPLIQAAKADPAQQPSLQKRLEERLQLARQKQKKAQEEKKKAQQDRAKKKFEENRKKAGEASANRQALFGPRPAPVPLVPKPDLGPPVIFDEGANKDGNPAPVPPP
jgi:hypothetical protein